MSTIKERAEIYGTKRWKRARRQALRRAGFLCEVCRAKGFRVAGAIVHHKLFLKRGGKVYELDNLQVVCKDCHERIHARPLTAEKKEWVEYIQRMGEERVEKSESIR